MVYVVDEYLLIDEPRRAAPELDFNVHAVFM